MPRVEWTTEEEDILYKYASLPIEALCKKLPNRTPVAIRVRAVRIGACRADGSKINFMAKKYLRPQLNIDEPVKPPQSLEEELADLVSIRLSKPKPAAVFFDQATDQGMHIPLGATLYVEQQGYMRYAGLDGIGNVRVKKQDGAVITAEATTVMLPFVQFESKMNYE